MTRCWRLLFLALFLTVSAFAEPHENVEICRKILTEKSGRLSAAEAQALASFEVKDIIAERIAELSDSEFGGRVLLVPTKSGHTFVLRGHHEMGQVGFEQFASTFINSAPGGMTPQIRLLSRKTLDAIESLAEAAGKNLFLRGTDSNSGAAASLALYYPAKRGDQYLLETNGATLSFALLQFVKAANVAPRVRESYLEEDLLSVWNETAPNVRRDVMRQLQEMIPEFKRMGAEDFFRMIGAQPGKFANKVWAFEAMRVSSWVALPKNVRRQLANQWALYTVLGIPDLHRRNWLVFEDTVIAIDAALPSEVFLKGKKELWGEDHEWVLDDGLLSARMISRFARDVDQALIDHLVALTPERIQGYSNAFKLTETQIGGIQKRAAHLAKARMQ